MNNSAHPDTDRLLGFLENPEDAEYAELSLHLATCSKCRQEMATLSSLTQQLVSFRRGDPHSTDIPTQQMEKLKRLLDNKLSPQQQEEFQQEMQNDNELLKASLHFTTHSEAMKLDLPSAGLVTKNIDSQARSDSNGQSADGFIASKLMQHVKNFFQWTPPLWSTATIAAVLVISLSLNLQQLGSKQANIDIIAYQDNPVVTFTSQQDNTPGIGFFNTIETSTKPFTDIQITSLNNNSLAISWPKVANTTEYSISLNKITPDSSSLVEQQQVSTNSAVFTNTTLPSLSGSSRFEWELLGVTKDKKAFKARGGFVIRNNQ